MYAYIDESDDFHKSAGELLQNHPGPLIVPMLVISEVVHLIANRRLGVASEKKFLDDIAEGYFVLEPVEMADWQRIGELVIKYGDLPLGTVDASVVATAERLGIKEIATTDLRHFTVVRPIHTDYFSLVLES